MNWTTCWKAMALPTVRISCCGRTGARSRDGSRSHWSRPNGHSRISCLHFSPDHNSPIRPSSIVGLDLDLVLQFPFWRGWDAGARVNVGTGIPYTRAVGGFAFYRARLAGDGGRLEWAGRRR